MLRPLPEAAAKSSSRRSQLSAASGSERLRRPCTLDHPARRSPTCTRSATRPSAPVISAAPSRSSRSAPAAAPDMALRSHRRTDSPRYNSPAPPPAAKIGPLAGPRSAPVLHLHDPHSGFGKQSRHHPPVRRPPHPPPSAAAALATPRPPQTSPPDEQTPLPRRSRFSHSANTRLAYRSPSPDARTNPPGPSARIALSNLLASGLTPGILRPHPNSPHPLAAMCAFPR